jgi:hypothetical protein
MLRGPNGIRRGGQDLGRNTAPRQARAAYFTGFDKGASETLLKGLIQHGQPDAASDYYEIVFFQFFYCIAAPGGTRRKASLDQEEP